MKKAAMAAGGGQGELHSYAGRNNVFTRLWAPGVRPGHHLFFCRPAFCRLAPLLIMNIDEPAGCRIGLRRRTRHNNADKLMKNSVGIRRRRIAEGATSTCAGQIDMLYADRVDLS